MKKKFIRGQLKNIAHIYSTKLLFFNLLKRAIDIFLSIFICIIIFPVIIVIPLAIWYHLGRPILFKQVRIGKKGKPFILYKFRTMQNIYDSSGKLLPDKERLTTFGSWLRKTSLDEIPTLWNVIKGDMSLVGPRPLLPEYLPYYTKREAIRHEVKPGITGLTQIKGRNLLKWNRKLALDVWYVNNQSLCLDIYILIKTLAVVINRQGINNPGHVTMPLLSEERDKKNR